jgi:hypothetical protein
MLTSSRLCIDDIPPRARLGVDAQFALNHFQMRRLFRASRFPAVRMFVQSRAATSLRAGAVRSCAPLLCRRPQHDQPIASESQRTRGQQWWTELAWPRHAAVCVRCRRRREHRGQRRYPDSHDAPGNPDASVCFHQWTCQLICPARLQRFDISADWPHCEISADELTYPVAGNGQRSAKCQRNILSLSKKTAKRAPLDVPQVFGRLRSDVNDPLHVGDGQDVIHEMRGLQERSERYVVESPDQQCPYGRAE